MGNWQTMIHGFASSVSHKDTVRFITQQGYPPETIQTAKDFLGAIAKTLGYKVNKSIKRERTSGLLTDDTLNKGDARPIETVAYRGYGRDQDRNDGMEYFAEREDVAKSYGPNVKSETLRFDNPLDMTDMGTASKVMSEIAPDTFDPDAPNGGFSPLSVMVGVEYMREDLRDWALANGYDGIILPTTKSPGSMELAGRAFIKLSKVKFSPSRQTDTPEFKKWFGDSKVVDKDGKPLVVYHGTTADITEFDPARTQQTSGIFFASNPEYANAFAQGRSGNGNVMPVFLSLQNPAYIEVNDYNYDTLNSDMSDEGSDGVIVRNEDGSIYVVVAKEPTQIKSAIGNSGAFDGSNPEIGRAHV
jgi:hypothetical protein